MIELVGAEYLGTKITVLNSTMPELKGMNGIVVGETRNMFLVRTGSRELNVPKKCCTFSIATSSGEFRVHGRNICLKPENRLKEAERIIKNMKRVN
ncbi:MAG: ribonuclease P protein subunit [Candidatus Thermoplasmatota archaeon]|jgi:RNase P/RNase MRP subunit p29|nr:ribonuclease P protein subunit [Candidatus Thermoplasmatota archaeon]